MPVADRVQPVGLVRHRQERQDGNDKATRTGRYPVEGQLEVGTPLSRVHDPEARAKQDADGHHDAGALSAEFLDRCSLLGTMASLVRYGSYLYRRPIQLGSSLRHNRPFLHLHTLDSIYCARATDDEQCH